MTLEELRLHRTVQGIMVRNYVNTQRTDIEVIGNSIYIEGELDIFEYHSSMRKKDPTERDLETARVLLHIEKQLRGLAEVNHIEWKLRNWQRVGLQWVHRQANA